LYGSVQLKANLPHQKHVGELFAGDSETTPRETYMSDSQLTRKEAERELERLEYQLSRLQDSDKNSERKAELTAEIERLRAAVKRPS
jgi:DNA repair ATPase RecN